MSTAYTVVWNPAPIVTHIMDDSRARTLCGLRVERGWEAGDYYEAAGELGNAYVGCHRCSRAAEKLAAVTSKSP